MSWQGIVVIVIMAIEVLCAAFVDGEPKTGKISFARTLVTNAIWAMLLYTGGFWS